MRKSNAAQLSLAAHGIEVARVMKGQADPVAAQVHGYLRWYADLSRSKGYLYLADLLRKALVYKDGTRQQMEVWVRELADKNLQTANAVSQSVVFAIRDAIQSNPDFASQVLNGLRHKATLHSFLNHSVQWLVNYQLSPHWIAPDQWEAVWSETKRKQERERPFISMLDYYIVKRICQGEGQEAVAHEYHCTTDELGGRYEQTTERARMIASMTCALPPPAPDASIEVYLERLGFPPYKPSTALIAEAIRLLQEEPERIKSITKSVYAVIGQQFGLKPNTVSSNIRQAYLRVSRCSKLTGQNAHFYKAIDYGNADMKTFFRTFLSYMKQSKEYAMTKKSEGWE